MKKLKYLAAVLLVMCGLLNFVGPAYAQIAPPPNPDPEGIGMEGRLITPPPTTPPTISIPADGTVFNSTPVTVAGLCTDTLLVRVFKNNVFSGAAYCDGGSYELQIDLFPGQNELVARQYDGVDQSSPDSNKRNITYLINPAAVPGAPAEVLQLILTSPHARMGANPGEELIWPMSLSGGRGPYAISVDWGDSKSDLSTLNAPGSFNSRHVYERPGVYKVIIKATDADGRSAFLQLVGIANGAINPGANAVNAGPVVVRTSVMWQPALISFPLMIGAFYLGMKYKLKRIRYRIKNHITPVDQ